MTDFQKSKEYSPVSRVTLKLDDNNVITSGDDTGFEVIGTCPYATQHMVDEILERLRGYVYTPFTATAAGLDPAAELGDGIQVGGIYSVISQVDDDGNGYPNVSAPGQGKIEEAFPDDGPLTTAINRKIAETNSLITKTAEEITLEVFSIKTDLSTATDDLQGQISDTEDRIGQLEQSVALTVTQDQVNVSIKEAIDGINSITTETGYKFDKDGLYITQTESDTITVIDSTGLLVTDKSGNPVLTAQGDNVNAKNLNATTYLSVGGRARFENIGTDRVGCFWIGG